MESRVITKMVETIVILNANISSMVNVVITGSCNATFFTCKTYFQWDNTSSPDSTLFTATDTSGHRYIWYSSAATNTPGYSYTWNSSVIHVYVTATTLVQMETTVTAGSCKQFC